MNRGYRYSLIRRQFPFTSDQYNYYITDFNTDKVYTCSVGQWETLSTLVKEYLQSSTFEWVADSDEFEALLATREYL